jgi:hypothetical protein
MLSGSQQTLEYFSKQIIQAGLLDIHFALSERKMSWLQEGF